MIRSEILRWAAHVARMEESTSAFKILTGIPTGKRPLGRPRRRWEDNISMNLKEIGIISRNLVDLPQDRDYWRALVNVTLNLQLLLSMVSINIHLIQGFINVLRFSSSGG